MLPLAGMYSISSTLLAFDYPSGWADVIRYGIMYLAALQSSACSRRDGDDNLDCVHLPVFPRAVQVLFPQCDVFMRLSFEKLGLILLGFDILPLCGSEIVRN